MPYLILKWLHIVSAIAALGSNITYNIWIGRASRAPANLLYTLQTIQYIDERLANRAYGVLLLTGLIMVYVARWALTTPWLLTALLLYVIVAGLGFFGYGRTLRKQIELAQSPGPESSEYQAVARRSNLFGIITIILVVAIVFLMVVKPPLWG